jgi:tyrosyl-tRNA synthetase
MSKPTIDEQVAILMRGAEFGDHQIAEHMQAELRERLIECEKTGRCLRVYCGYDPTAPDIHLGHTVTMRKLRQFQALGHTAIFLIGTFTGLVGDPSDRDRARPRRLAEELAENARTYVQQAYRILDPLKTEVRYNADWLAKLTFADVINLAANFTVQQFLARDRIALRYERGEPVGLHEFLYALMQGYDAVALETDVQVGGTEQLFNLMVGRRLQESFGQRPQVCLTFPILVGTDGHERMSKSTGNYVGIDEPPETKYGKTMSIPDAAMRNWLDLVTRWTPAQIDELLGALERGEVHPMEAKKRLAWEIVAALDGDEAAERAAAHFARVHQQRELPQDMPVLTFDGPANIVDIIFSAGIVRSKSDARRLIRDGAVSLDGERVPSPYRVVHGLRHSVAHTRLGEKDSSGYREQILDHDRRQVLQVGRRHFFRLSIPEED